MLPRPCSPKRPPLPQKSPDPVPENQQPGQLTGRKTGAIVPITAARETTCLFCLKKQEEEPRPPKNDLFLSARRQQPSGRQHGRQLWDPDDRAISRSPQLLSFIRGMWADGAGGTGIGQPRPLASSSPPLTHHPRPPLSCARRGSAATAGVHGGLSAITSWSG